MKKFDWTKWSAIAEVLSAVAIVVTLAYLAVQTSYVREQTELQVEQNEQNLELLRQNTLHTSHLLRDQIQSRIAEANEIYLDQNPAPIIEKSLLTPGELTFSEFRVVDAYLINGVNIWESYRLLADAGLITEEEWRSRVKANAGWFFGNEYAKAWWEEVGRTVFGPELTSVIEEALSEVTTTDSYDYYLESISRFQVE